MANDDWFGNAPNGTAQAGAVVNLQEPESKKGKQKKGAVLEVAPDAAPEVPPEAPPEILPDVPPADEDVEPAAAPVIPPVATAPPIATPVAGIIKEQVVAYRVIRSEKATVNGCSISLYPGEIHSDPHLISALLSQGCTAIVPVSEKCHLVACPSCQHIFPLATGG